MKEKYERAQDVKNRNQAPLMIALAIFSASISGPRQSIIQIETQGKRHNLQTVDWGCPGGRNGNADASTTLTPWTPYTLA